MKNVFAAVTDLSLTAKVIAGALFAIFCVTGMMLLWRLNNHFLILVPMSGGAITQGVIGAPQFINPVLAATDADQDLVALVYSGLLRYGPNGNLIPDLAQSYSVSPDGLTLWVNSSIANAVFIYSLPDLKVKGFVKTGSVPDWITFTPDSKMIYIANSGANSVSAIDTVTRTEVARIPVGQVPKRNGTVVVP